MGTYYVVEETDREIACRASVGKGRDMDVIERVEELQVLVEEAKTVPLSSSAVVNREELLELLAQLKEELPEEIRQARLLTRDKEERLERARKEADRILAEAREQRDRLLSRTEIIHAAERTAGRIVDEAKERATRMQNEADDYIDQKLAGFESVLTKVLTSVVRGREQLNVERDEEEPTEEEDDSSPASADRPFDAAQFTSPGR